MSKQTSIIILLTLLLGLVACGGQPTPNSGDILAPLPTSAEAEAADQSSENLPTLLDLLSEDPNLVFFANGLNSAGLTDDLLEGGPFTIFAPSNVAFSEAGLIVSQMDPALIGAIVDNHLVDGTFSESDLLAAGSVATLAGEQLAVEQGSDGLQIAYAPLVAEARAASNGMLFVIDTLLLPPETGPEKSMWGVLQADGRFTTFISTIEGTELMGTLRFGELADAVLAPTDEAFANMPANVASYLESDPHALEFIVAYHLLSPDGWPQDKDLTLADLVELGEIPTRVAIGGSGFGQGFEKILVTSSADGVQIGGANVLAGDIDATNGTVHIIDQVLIPQAIFEHTE